MKSSGILIANRGEISVRIARAAAELGIRSVCIYSEDDKNSLHTKISNEAALIPGMGAKAYLDIDSIISTDVLFNPSKEYVAKPKNDFDVHRFLVRSKDDIVGQSLTQTLQDRFDLAGLKSIKRGVVWEIKINSASLKKDVDLILNSHIFSNPVSQECHEY